MTIKRTNKLFQKNFLKKNNHLKILDLGCTHINYWEEANHFADIVDYSKIIVNQSKFNSRCWSKCGTVWNFTT